MQLGDVATWRNYSCKHVEYYNKLGPDLPSLVSLHSALSVDGLASGSYQTEWLPFCVFLTHNLLYFFRKQAGIQDTFMTYTVYDDVITFKLIQEACKTLSKNSLFLYLLSTDSLVQFRCCLYAKKPDNGSTWDQSGVVPFQEKLWKAHARKTQLHFDLLSLREGKEGAIPQKDGAVHALSLPSQLGDPASSLNHLGCLPRTPLERSPTNVAAFVQSSFTAHLCHYNRLGGFSAPCAMHTPARKWPLALHFYMLKIKVQDNAGVAKHLQDFVYKSLPRLTTDICLQNLKMKNSL